MAAKELMRRILEVVYEESDRYEQEDIVDAFVFVFAVILINENMKLSEAINKFRATHARVMSVWSKINVLEWL